MTVTKERIEALRQIASQPYVSRITTLELRDIFEYYEAQLLTMEESQEQREQERLVVLPVKAAEAIEWFRNQIMSNEDIYDLSYEEDDGLYASALFHWVEGNGSRDELMQALVNGYTVETLESKIKTGVLQTYREWLLAPCEPTEAADEENFAQMVTDLVTQIIREDGATG